MWVPVCSAMTSSADAPVRDSAASVLVPAVQRQGHARLVRRVDRDPGVAGLLEVVDPSVEERVDHAMSRPAVSGRTSNAAIAST